VGDSEEDNDVDLVEDGGESDSYDDTAQPKQLRQTTLMELFYPLRAPNATNYR
jgi:hypothetical protein